MLNVYLAIIVNHGVTLLNSGCFDSFVCWEPAVCAARNRHSRPSTIIFSHLQQLLYTESCVFLICSLYDLEVEYESRVWPVVLSDID